MSFLDDAAGAGRRSITGVSTYTIAPPLRREWPLTCQGLPAPQHNRPPYRSVMRMERATCVVAPIPTPRVKGLVHGQNLGTSILCDSAG